jgi:hypothetical protein
VCHASTDFAEGSRPIVFPAILVVATSVVWFHSWELPDRTASFVRIMDKASVVQSLLRPYATTDSVVIVSVVEKFAVMAPFVLVVAVSAFSGALERNARQGLGIHSRSKCAQPGTNATPRSYASMAAVSRIRHENNQIEICKAVGVYGQACIVTVQENISSLNLLNLGKLQCVLATTCQTE